MRRLRQYLQDIFYLDIRALAAFRIGLALVLLADVILRLRFFARNYTDAGVLPAEAARKLNTTLWASAISDSDTIQQLIYSALIIACIALLVGFKTRLAAATCWLLFTLVQIRNPVVNDRGDDVVRVILLWATVLPIARCWSWDCRGQQLPSRRAASIASGALILQIACIYVLSGWLKTGAWLDGNATYHALSVEWFTTSLGLRLLEFPELLSALTPIVLYWERLVFLPLLIPRPWGRILFVLSIWGFHLGSGIAMRLGIFPWICSVMVMLVLPSEFWEFVGRRVKRLQLVFGEQPPRQPKWVAVIAGIFLGFVVVYNFCSAGRFYVPGPIDAVGRVIRINQTWDMFAPTPARTGGWFSIVAKTPRGKIDLNFGGGPPQTSYPKLPISETYDSERNGLYLYRLLARTRAHLRPHFAKWLCRERRELAIGELQIWYYGFRATPGKGRSKPRGRLVHRTNCRINKYSN